MGNTEEREVHSATEELLRRLAARTTEEREQQPGTTVVYVLGNHNVIYCNGGAGCPVRAHQDHKG